MVIQLNLLYIESEDDIADYIIVSSPEGRQGEQLHLILASVNKIAVQQDPDLKDHLLVFWTEHLARVYQKMGREVEFVAPGEITH